jgi:quercetin dioxygenase-like cupin family protein
MLGRHERKTTQAREEQDMHNQRTITRLVAALVAAAALAAPVALVTASHAEPPKGVKATVLARANLDAFKVRSAHDAPFDFMAKAKDPMDLVVRQHDYDPGSSTGWHQHPGPVFITVTKGTLTYYEYDDPNCTRHDVHAGQAFVDDGHGHIVRNETGEPAQDISIITAAADDALPFRSNLPNPGPYCPF